MKTIADTLSDAASLKTMGIMVRGAFLLGTLAGPEIYTVFTPTNAAVARLPEEVFDGLFDDRSRLAEAVAYHVVPGKIMIREMASMNSAQTLYRRTLQIRTSQQDVTVNGARIIQADVECANGIIHVIDAVLLPPALQVAA